MDKVTTMTAEDTVDVLKELEDECLFYLNKKLRTDAITHEQFGFLRKVVIRVFADGIIMVKKKRYVLGSRQEEEQC